MKRNYLKSMVWAAIVSMSMSMVACSSDDYDDDDDDGDDVEIVLEDGATLEGDIANGQTVLLKEGRSFKLSGGYAVKNGGLLKIEKGVTITAIKDDAVDYIIVEQGGKIDAQGTADEPIVMTAEDKRPKGWGGIHICGYAHSNKGTGVKSEIGNAPYGGDKEDDNSGTLRYIRLEYTGYAFDEETESNGATFYGVGSGTTVEYLQSYKGADDGFEFFGGSVNVKYLVATDNEDDSFDWTEGWNGKAQFLVADQRGTSGEGDSNGDCLIEADNLSSNFAATPVSCPTLSNLTLIGNGSTGSKRGIRLRAGTQAKIYNAIIVGKPQCLTTETAETEQSLVDGVSVLNYITLATDIVCNESLYSSALFGAVDNHNTINSTFSFAEGSVAGTIDGGADLSADFFFTNAQYQGAVKADEDWTAGWTKK